MAFHVIAVAEGLGPSDEARAIEAGPAFVAAEANYPTLLNAAGFHRVQVRDDSHSFRKTAASWFHEWAQDAAILEPLFGEQEFQDRQASRRDMLDAIDYGLLKRFLITAHAGP